MTLLELEILFHYHCSPIEFERISDCIEQIKSDFVSQGMLESNTEPSFKRKYQTTDKGKFYIEYLQSIPLPITKFEIPITPPTTKAEDVCK